MKRIFFRVLALIAALLLTVQIGAPCILAISDAAPNNITNKSDVLDASYNFKFGLTDNGVTVNKDGSWSVEMYLDGANDLFEYDAWYGIYDLGVEPAADGDSKGAWGYVMSKTDSATECALEADGQLPSKRFTFRFDSKTDLTEAAEGCSNPVVSGTYNLYLFYSRHGEDQYKIARSTVITIGEPVDLIADYEHVIVIGIDGAGTFFKDAATPNIDRIFEDSPAAVSYKAKTEYPSRSAENWTSMLHGVPVAYHGMDNDLAYANDFYLSAYPSVFKVIRDNYPEADLGAFSHWSPINTAIIENDIGIDKVHGIGDEALTEEIVKYVKENAPKFVFIQMDEADEAGHDYGFGTQPHLDKISELDGYVGDIHKAYAELGILDKTLFIVTSDHGGTLDMGPEGGFSGEHGGESADEMNVMFAASGRTVLDGEIGEMRTRDVAAVVLHALGCSIPGVYQSDVPDDLFVGVSRQPKLSFGLTDKGVAVSGSTYEIEMYLEGADARFGHDAWFGIYNGSVTPEELYANGDAHSLGAFGYVSPETPVGERLGSQRYVFSFSSSDMSASEEPLKIGGAYTVFLFYTDGYDGNRYVVADAIAVTLENKMDDNFGLAGDGVVLRADGSVRVDMNLLDDGNLYSELWYGIYPADVSAADIKAGKADISAIARDFVTLDRKNIDLPPVNYLISFDSAEWETDTLAPGMTYNVYLFNAFDGICQYDVCESFAFHVPSEVNTGDGYLRFGFEKDDERIIVRTDNTWVLSLFIEGADARFDKSAWVGIYSSDITVGHIFAGGSDITPLARVTIGEFDSEEFEFILDSSMITSADEPLEIGGAYNLVLFCTDESPDSSVAIRSVPFRLLPSSGVMEVPEPEPIPEPIPEPEPEPEPELEAEPEPEIVTEAVTEPIPEAEAPVEEDFESWKLVTLSVAVSLSALSAILWIVTKKRFG